MIYWKRIKSEICFFWTAAPACPNNLIHKECGSCQLQCGSGSNVAGCEETTCFDGCFCPQGMVLDKGKCVYPEQCPCLHGDQMLPAGSVVPKDCNKWSVPIVVMWLHCKHCCNILSSFFEFVNVLSLPFCITFLRNIFLHTYEILHLDFKKCKLVLSVLKYECKLIWILR